MLQHATTLETLRDGDIEIVGRIVSSSNNAMLVRVTRPCRDPGPATVLDAIYKPTLGERPLGDLLAELERRGVQGIAASEPPTAGVDDTGPLDEPINEAFRAGSLTLGWDGDAERVLVEARAQPEDGEEMDADDDDDEDEDGPDLLRVRMTADAARSFVARAARIVAGGRPPCPLCGAPLDPQGHICPRRNGHYIN